MRLLCISLMVVAGGCAGARVAAPVQNASLRSELLERAAADQRVRREMDSTIRLVGDPQRIDPVTVRRWQTVDAENSTWLKSVVRLVGWPGIRMVGADGAQAAWLIVQHADRDIEFQKEALPLMEAAVRAGDASGTDFAYLTDRVRVAEGRPQVYGTQARMVDGRRVTFPIEDGANVNARRAAVGLPPLVLADKPTPS